MSIRALLMAAAGVRSSFVFVRTISADVTLFSLDTELTAAGWNGSDQVNAIVTINSGIVVSSNNTGTPALRIPGGLPVGSTVALVVRGYICGMGGAGGGVGQAGNPGGPALNVGWPCTIDAASGVIAGGGGGGGGGGGYFFLYGGGGQGGRVNSGGANPGTFAAPGNGGGSVGGKGGAWGQSGAGGSGGSGGAAGAAVQGNSFITWINSGTRHGALTG